MQLLRIADTDIDNTISHGSFLPYSKWLFAKHWQWLQRDVR